MKPQTPEDIYEDWLTGRRQEFSGTDLSCLVMASVRSIEARPASPSRRLKFASRFAMPSTLVGAARLIFFALLVLTPA